MAGGGGGVAFFPIGIFPNLLTLRQSKIHHLRFKNVFPIGTGEFPLCKCEFTGGYLLLKVIKIMASQPTPP